MKLTEREEFEMVAKAAGRTGEHYTTQGMTCDMHHFWNPRTDDGDSFSLMVKMGMRVEVNLQSIVASWIDHDACESHETYRYYSELDDPEAATMEAIWQCALECARRGK